MNPYRERKTVATNLPGVFGTDSNTGRASLGRPMSVLGKGPGNAQGSKYFGRSERLGRLSAMSRGARPEVGLPLTIEASQSADFSFDEVNLFTAMALLNPSSQQIAATITVTSDSGLTSRPARRERAEAAGWRPRLLRVRSRPSLMSRSAPRRCPAHRFPAAALKFSPGS